MPGRSAVAILAALLVAGCAATPSASMGAPSPTAGSPAPSGDRASPSVGSPTPGTNSPSPDAGIPADGLVDIGGRSLFVECTGSGSPTIVLEAGLGTNHTTWQQLTPLLTSEGVQVCAYDRAGRGTSDAADPPRTAGDVVDDLAQLLARAGIATPIVLVGHSFGGLTARLFAARHPEEVAGLVLIDPPPETWLEDVCSVDATACEQLRSALAPDSNPEGIDWAATVGEITSAGPLPPRPLVVMAAAGAASGLTPDLIALRTTRLRELADSVPGGRLVIVESGHFIQLDKPEAVAEAVRSVLAAVRAAAAAPAAS